jgi:iron complex transport system ATP-binding protein
MIRISNVTKAYKNNLVLDSVSVSIPNSKFVSLIGPNGCGKSTLINCICSLIDYDGHIFIDEVPIKAIPKKELAKKISLLKQNSFHDLKITSTELISFGRFPYSNGNLTKEDDKKIEEVIQFLELESLQSNYITELSGGERQRVYIGMMLAQDTEYMILDEPLNNLDMKNSKHIMSLLKKFVEEKKKTVILVVHDINFASMYSDEIIAIKDHDIFASGKTKAIINEDVLTSIYDTPIRVTNTDIGILCNFYK